MSQERFDSIVSEGGNRSLTPDEKARFELRRQRALAGLDAFIDVASAWRGRYADDDEPAGIEWITSLIPQCQDDPISGWLCVRGTDTPAIGWRITDGYQFAIDSICRSFRGHSFPVTRAAFREAAHRSGADLPARHATLYLDHRARWEESLRPPHGPPVLPLSECNKPITHEALNCLLDIALARLECGISPIDGMAPGTLGLWVAELAIELHSKGMSREQSWAIGEERIRQETGEQLHPPKSDPSFSEAEA